MDSFALHMFTEAVQSEQQTLGMRDRFQKAYRNRFTDGLDEDTKAFIATRTSFYMASVGETGWPYIQHRGGSSGFLKLLDYETLGFAGYTGNKQVITKGNLKGNDRVSLFLMDYPRRARLKMIGHATMIDASDDPDLAARLAAPGDNPTDHLTTIHITAYDWNCPKYIVPRYTEAEIEAMLGPRLRDLTEENARLRKALAERNTD
ncbi:MAG: pyridoxamine 5'-phosphate oxidase family protein [Boseongicola sp.]|nr:MAG: pyridoxamine 5'-phosphate oxidase family protein [Boseongicola sp.]